MQPWVDEWDNLVSLFHLPTGEHLDPRHFFFAPWPYLHGRNYLGIPEVEAIRHEIEVNNIQREARDRYIHKRTLAPLVAVHSSSLTPKERTAREAEVDKMESMSVLHISGKIDPITKKVVPSTQFEQLADQASQSLLQQLQHSIGETGKDISRTIGIPDLLGVTDTAAGSWALGRTQFDVFTARPAYAQQWLSHHINVQLIRDIVRFNFPEFLKDRSYKLPRFGFHVRDQEHESRKAERMMAEVDRQLRTPEEYRAAMEMGPLQGAAETKI